MSKAYPTESRKSFFSDTLSQIDNAILSAVQEENARQEKQIELIASENIVSKAVMEAQGTVLTNKYAEGYPGRRYYGGCEHVDTVEALAIESQPKMIIAGGSAIPRTLDLKRFRDIADKVGAYLMVDMAHIAGLIATGAHPSPLPYADIVTTTTHKTLRGPRGGMILSNNLDLGKKIK